MIHESGRSLLEVIGVMAIAGLMTVGAFSAYQVMRTNQTRTIANADLNKLVEDTKLLFESRGTYDGVSVEYLIKAGALKSDASPLGGADWSVVSSADGNTFSINLVDLTNGECEYFATNRPTWATMVLVNGLEVGMTTGCFDSNTNQLSFIVE